MKWDEWRGSMDGRPTMWIKNLVRIGWFRIDLHKMVGKDDEACFHTHPAAAVRVVLYGGYGEQLSDFQFVNWLPGMVGIVRPELCHRIAYLLNSRVSYSLWIRLKKKHKVILRGAGWSLQRQNYRADDTVME